MLKTLIAIIAVVVSVWSMDDYKRSQNMVKDLKRNLLWQDDYRTESLKMSWQEAKQYCQSLNDNGLAKWRLPT